MLLISSLLPCAGFAEAMAPESLTFSPFGKVMVYRKTPHPSQVVLFVSGDGGWARGVIDMAQALMEMDALVLGVDFPKYQKTIAASKEKCLYCAADFENLSKYAQKILAFPSYIRPTLLGYSSGATLVYALLVQAPPNSYHGVVSLGFCPDLILPKPMCKGRGLEWEGPFKGKGYVFSSVKRVDVPWIVFQGMIDQVCNPPSTEAFVKEVDNAQIVPLPKVGHGYSVTKNWMPQFKEIFTTLFREKEASPTQPTSVSDLPLEEAIPSENHGDYLAVIVTGDGGWATIDKEIAANLSKEGIPVVGLNSLSYFWTKRNPEMCAKDLERIIRHYLDHWRKEKVLLIGYSFGAEVLPFMINGISADLRQHIQSLALIAPSPSADFEINVGDWINQGSANPVYPVLPELKNLKEIPSVVCIGGSDETDGLCREIKLPWVKTIILPGGHHLGGDYRRLTQTILENIETIRGR